MILVAGENLVDLLPTEAGADGEPRFAARPGGSPYNCARALGRLGARVGYLTPISTDPMGDLLAAGLAEAGVRHLGGRSPRPAALALVTLADGQPHYRFYRTGTADRDVTAATLSAANFTEARVLHMGSMAFLDGPDAEALADLFTDTARRGLVATLDPNIRPAALPACKEPAYRARLARLCAAATLIKLSDEDLAWLHPGLPLETAAMALQAAHAPPLLVVTRGAAGVLAFAGARRLTLPAAPVARLADTVGAGDSFMAALLASLDASGQLSRAAIAALPEAELAAHLTRATCAAALTCSRPGCDPPTKAELDAACG